MSVRRLCQTRFRLSTIARRSAPSSSSDPQFDIIAAEVQMRSYCLVVLLAACGSVSAKNDAGHDGPGGHSAAPADVAGDAAVPPFTAIGAGTITQFSPGSFVDTVIPYNYDYDDLSEWSN